MKTWNYKSAKGRWELEKFNNLIDNILLLESKSVIMDVITYSFIDSFNKIKKVNTCLINNPYAGLLENTHIFVNVYQEHSDNEHFIYFSNIFEEPKFKKCTLEEDYNNFLHKIKNGIYETMLITLPEY